MDITMIGLQNAGKTSLLRVLAVSLFPIQADVAFGVCLMMLYRVESLRSSMCDRRPLLRR